MDFEQIHSPGSCGIVSCEDTLKRRASKLPRQTTVTSNEERRSAPSIDCEVPSSIPGLSKNKIRRETSAEPETFSSINTPHERIGDLRVSRSFGSQNDVTPTNQSIQGVGKGLSLMFSGGKGASEEIPFAGTTTTTMMTCSFEGTTASRMRQSHVKPLCSQDEDEDSMDVLSRQRRGTPCDEATTASQCSEDVEIWQNEARSLKFTHGSKGNKQQKNADSRR